MCTLSWILNEHGYEVFFNRDEQRTRAKAIPPFLDKNFGTIMPVDPQGKGTWIATNLHGMTLCLLNNYQRQAEMNPSFSYLSRGKLVLELSGTTNNIDLKLEQLELKNYLPFFLCVFPDSLSSSNEAISIYQWNGTQLTQEQVEQPFISSSVFLAQVKKSRQTTFRQLTGTNGGTLEHIAYHSSHLPEKSHASVCMHREDACTQSLCHISVSNEIIFRYHDGPPCEDNRWSEIKIQKLFSANEHE